MIRPPYDAEPLPWTVLESRHVHRDRWVSLRADTCQTTEGVRIAPYYVLEYPDWTAVVALDEDQHVLLVEQYRHGIGAVALGLPGGGIDMGEDAAAAAKRELLEETGYSASNWRAIAKLANNPPSQNNWCHVMLAQGAMLTSVPHDDPAERVRMHRLSIDATVALAHKGELPHSVDVAALALALSAIDCWG